LSNKPVERTIRRTVQYRGKILDLYVDQIQIPKGSKHVREVVGHGPAVAMVPLLPGKKVVLIKQYRYAVGRTLWEIPAGLVDPQETPRHAAIRELREETGYRAKRLELAVKIYSSPGYCQERIHIYIARDMKKVDDLNLDEDESLTVAILPFQQALRMISEGKIVDGKTVLGLLWAARSMKKV
jgi:ADP-ribose diphosphatase